MQNKATKLVCPLQEGRLGTLWRLWRNALMPGSIKSKYAGSNELRTYAGLIYTV